MNQNDEFEASIEAFEEAWQRGTPPAIQVSSRDILIELISIDMEYRWQHNHPTNDALGNRPTLEDYARFLPELGPVASLPLAVVGEEYRVRHCWGDRPAPEQYITRFPHDQEELRTLLSQVDQELTWEGVRRSEVRSNITVHSDARAPLSYSDYLLTKHLGTGGMSKVYRATDLRRQRTVAVKSLLKSRQTDPIAVDLFVKEAATLDHLQHPNIVGVHGLGRYPGGGYFLVMDFVDGTDLAHRLKAGVFRVDEAIRIVVSVAEAIEYAHSQHVIHCDLKPSNILLDRDGKVWVSDFGFAQLLRPYSDSAMAPGVTGGTLAYMAPEQFDQSLGSIGPATDVYGLGALLYSLLTGQAPLQGFSIDEMFDRPDLEIPIRSMSFWRDDIPSELEAICMKCLRANPRERFATVRDVVREINRWWTR